MKKTTVQCRGLPSSWLVLSPLLLQYRLGGSSESYLLEWTVPQSWLQLTCSTDSALGADAQQTLWRCRRLQKRDSLEPVWLIPLDEIRKRESTNSAWLPLGTLATRRPSHLMHPVRQTPKIQKMLVEKVEKSDPRSLICPVNPIALKLSRQLRKIRCNCVCRLNFVKNRNILMGGDGRTESSDVILCLCRHGGSQEVP